MLDFILYKHFVLKSFAFHPTRRLQAPKIPQFQPAQGPANTKKPPGVRQTPPQARALSLCDTPPPGHFSQIALKIIRPVANMVRGRACIA